MMSELAKLTGHKDLRSLMRYTHIAPEHSPWLVERMAAATFGTPGNS